MAAQLDNGGPGELRGGLQEQLGNLLDEFAFRKNLE